MKLFSPLVSNGVKIQRNIPLEEYTTFKIGGRAKYFCAVKDKKDLIEAVAFAKKERLPFFILGGGSNLLVSDKGYDGLIIKMLNVECNILNNKMQVGAGVGLGQAVRAAADAGLSGLEWASGIPGTIGGAVRGNAGAFGGEMKDIVKTVEFLDAGDLNLSAGKQRFKIYNLKKCRFDYRDSIFKKNKNLIIFSCGLQFKKGDKEKIQEKVKEYLAYRQLKHPKEPSAGSVFKNVGSTPAALLIHQCGLTGKKIGQAQVSQKHSNFIINLGGAKAKDVLGLVDLIKKEVKNKLGVKIEEEIQFL